MATPKSSLLRLGPQCCNPCGPFRNVLPACITPDVLKTKKIVVTNIEVSGSYPGIPSGDYFFVCSGGITSCSMTFMNSDCTGVLFIEGDEGVIQVFGAEPGFVGDPLEYDPDRCGIANAISALGFIFSPAELSSFFCDFAEYDLNTLGFGGGAHYKFQLADAGSHGDPDCNIVSIPELPPCEAAFSDCDATHPLVIYFGLFSGCSYAGNEAGTGDFTGFKTYENLNGVTYFANPGQSIYSECNDLSFDYDALFYILLGRADTSDYSDPGILLERREYTTATNFHSETYCWGITFALKCDPDTGKVGIVRVMLDKQEFRGIDGTSWPPSTTGTATSTCEVFSDIDFETTGYAGACIVYGSMTTNFFYDLCGDSTAEFYALATF